MPAPAPAVVAPVNRRRRHTKVLVGLVLLVAVAVGSAVVVPMVTAGAPPEIVYTEFSRAGLALPAGATVRIRDLPVGTVQAVNVVSGNHSVIYRLALDPGTRVAAGTSATIVPITLLGEDYIALQPAGPGQQVLRPGETVPLSRTNPGVTLEHVLNLAQPVLQALQPVTFGDILASVATGLSGSASAMRTISTSLTPPLADLAQQSPALGTLLTSIPGVAGTIDQRMAELVTAANDFSATARALTNQRGQLGSFLQQNAQLMASASQLLAQQSPALDSAIPSFGTVMGALAAQPARVGQLITGADAFINGLAAATRSGTFISPIANFGVLNLGSAFQAPGSLSAQNGGPGLGPAVDVVNPPLPSAVTVPLLAPAKGGLGGLLQGIAGGPLGGSAGGGL